MKKSKSGILFVLALSLGLISCDQQETPQASESIQSFTLKVASDGATNVSSTEAENWESVVLSDLEKEHLEWIGEQEKMEKEVFGYFATLYDLPLWGNMSASEATHLGIVEEALEVNALALPGEETGVFSQESITDFYNSLISQGTQEQNEALLASLVMEEGVLADLMERATSCSDASLLEMVGSLQVGVRNHLRALFKVSTRFQLVYEPEFLDKAVFDQIVTSDFERQASCTGTSGTGRQYRHRYGADGSSAGNDSEDGSCGRSSGGGKQYRGGKN